MTRTKGTAVVTGASSGIGAVYADRLAAQGYDLVLVARSADKLQHVADRIRSKHGRKADIFPADLTDRSEVERVERYLKETSGITMLVNNAGLGGTGTVVESDVDAMSRMISLNVDALMRLTYAVVPQFVARGTGTIINIASIVAITPEQLNGVYGGTKAFVLAFSQSLRKELEDTDIQVQVVLPGATATDFWALSGKPVESLPVEIVMSSDDMVDASIAGLEQGEFVTIPALRDAKLWSNYETARRAMFGKLSSSVPASRYGFWLAA
jgi:hypothetical protein